MAVKSPRSGYTMTKEDLSKGGKNSKRPKSIKNLWIKYLDEKIPESIVKELQERKILIGGTLQSQPLEILDKYTGDAIAMAVVAEALKREPWAVKLLVEQLEGRAKEKVELSGPDDGPIQTDNGLSPKTIKEIEDILYADAAKRITKK